MTIHKIANYSCSNLPENGAVWKNTDHFSDLITCADSSHTARAEQTVWEGVLLGRAQQADDGPTGPEDEDSSQETHKHPPEKHRER